MVSTCVWLESNNSELIHSLDVWVVYLNYHTMWSILFHLTPTLPKEEYTPVTSTLLGSIRFLLSLCASSCLLYRHLHRTYMILVNQSLQNHTVTLHLSILMMVSSAVVFCCASLLSAQVRVSYPLERVYCFWGHLGTWSSLNQRVPNSLVLQEKGKAYCFPLSHGYPFLSCSSRTYDKTRRESLPMQRPHDLCLCGGQVTKVSVTQ